MNFLYFILKNFEMFYNNACAKDLKLFIIKYAIKS